MKTVILKRMNQNRMEQVEGLYASLGREGSLSPNGAVEDDFREVPHFYLGYEGDRLVSYTEIVIDSRAVTVYSMTAPEARRKGYMKALWKACFEKLDEAGLGDLSWNVLIEPDDLDMQKVLRRYHGRKCSTDYMMGAYPAELSVKVGGKTWRDFVTEHHLYEYWNFTEDTATMTLWNGERIIGSVSRAFGDERDFLFDVRVKKAFRGQGIGRYMVERMLTRELTKRPVYLHVDDKKKVARHIYQSIGMLDVQELRTYRVIPSLLFTK